VTNSTLTMVPVMLVFRRSRIRGWSVFKASLGERLAGPSGELGGGHPSDEEELGFLEDVDKEPAALKVLNFLYPLSMKSPSILAVVMKET
jgi:hypothetical protein